MEWAGKGRQKGGGGEAGGKDGDWAGKGKAQGRGRERGVRAGKWRAGFGKGKGAGKRGIGLERGVGAGTRRVGFGKGVQGTGKGKAQERERERKRGAGKGKVVRMNPSNINYTSHYPTAHIPNHTTPTTLHFNYHSASHRHV